MKYENDMNVWNRVLIHNGDVKKIIIKDYIWICQRTQVIARDIVKLITPIVKSDSGQNEISTKFKYNLLAFLDRWPKSIKMIQKIAMTSKQKL